MLPLGGMARGRRNTPHVARMGAARRDLLDIANAFWQATPMPDHMFCDMQGIRSRAPPTGRNVGDFLHKIFLYCFLIAR